ncbi:MAG: YihY/virulence factor BrkB family protein [Thermomicrobiales bacterium]|nr:YihY/virulence factor BrkB family protein [Thermomicrobiales bacterium]
MREQAETTPVAPIDWRAAGTYKELGIELYREFSRDKVTTYAAAVAYSTVFAIPAFVILVVMAAAVVNRATDVAVIENLRQLINDHAPASTRTLLNEQVDNAIAKVDASGLSIGILLTAALALWSGSNAIGSMIEAFNRAYGVDEGRPFIHKKLVTFGLTLLLAVFINLAFALLVFGERIGSWLADLIEAGDLFDSVWGIGRWPAAVAAVAFFLALLYYWGPYVDHSFRWISPGSILATLLWLIATAGFGLYLSISNPGSAYGVVGSVLVLLYFLYVSAIIFIVGAELNAMLAKRADPKTVADLATKPEARPVVRANANERRRQLS